VCVALHYELVGATNHPRRNTAGDANPTDVFAQVPEYRIPPVRGYVKHASATRRWRSRLSA
jgi:hypothetical protein